MWPAFGSDGLALPFTAQEGQSGLVLDVATGTIEPLGVDFDLAVSADGSTTVGFVGNAWSLWNLEGIGVTYCDPVANTSGCIARILARGSDHVADGEFALVDDRLPANVFGMFVASLTPSLTASVPGNPSPLCLGGSITRFNRPGEILSSGEAGAFALEIDLSSIPSANAARPWRRAIHSTSRPGSAKTAVRRPPISRTPSLCRSCDATCARCSASSLRAHFGRTWRVGNPSCRISRGQGPRLQADLCWAPG